MSIHLWLECIHPLAASSRIIYHATKLRSKCFLHDSEFTVIKWPFDVVEIWDVVEIHNMDVQLTTFCCNHVNIDPNLWGIFLAPFWVYFMNHYISSEGRRVQPSISNVYLMMPISKYNTCGVCGLRLLLLKYIITLFYGLLSQWGNYLIKLNLYMNLLLGVEFNKLILICVHIIN